jgi:hypothetical protein
MTAQVVGRLLILALVMVRCSSGTLAQDAPSGAESVFAGETYLAETREALFIAVIIGPSEDGTPNHPARAFVCDDQRLGQWFTGEVVGGDVTLRPETSEREATPQPEARLIGTFSAGRITGEVAHEGRR